MVKRWVPRPGEIVHIDFSPTRGHEQANPRPAVVLSHEGFNERSGLAVCIPVTTKRKGFPFEVAIDGLTQPSVALVHQVRTLDWRERGAASAGFASDAELSEIRGKLGALLCL